MKVEVDQSGRLEHLDTDTVIAYANGKNGAVLVKISVKRYLVQGLKRTIIPHDRLMPYLFAVCIFLLVRDLDKRVVLEIDEEYTGKDDIVSEALLKLLGDTWKGDIRFKRIGKESPAHKLAWGIHRSDIKKKEMRKLKLDEILQYFRGS